MGCPNNIFAKLVNIEPKTNAKTDDVKAQILVTIQVHFVNCQKHMTCQSMHDQKYPYFRNPSQFEETTVIFEATFEKFLKKINGVKLFLFLQNRP